MAKNVLGGELRACCTDPMTGFYRNGTCDLSSDDPGMHTLCAVMTREFLDFTASRGNDLRRAMPRWGFPGLKAGDKWCLCLARWQEALAAGVAPPVDLAATHVSVLEYVDRRVLEEYAVAGEEE